MGENNKWDDIPAIQGLEIDWEYEPENPLGKRGKMRLAGDDFRELIGTGKIPVKVAVKGHQENGVLLDLAQGGLAVLTRSRLTLDQAAKVGLILGKKKIIARATVKNVNGQNGRFRTGMAFADLDGEAQEYIAGLISSRVLQKPL